MSVNPNLPAPIAYVPFSWIPAGTTIKSSGLRPFTSGFHVCIRDHSGAANPPTPGASEDHFH